MLKPGDTSSNPNYSKGPPGVLRAWCRLAHLIPAYPGINSIVLADDINGRGGEAKTTVTQRGGVGVEEEVLGGVN